MQKFTTTKLILPRAWWELSTPAAAMITACCLLAIALIVGGLRSAPAVVAAPTPALAFIIATTAPAPTSAPPTPDERVYQELAALREQVAQLQAAQQAAAPQVVNVPAEAPAPVEQPVAVEAAPTPAPAAPEMQIRTAAILDRDAWASTAATAKAGR